MKPVPTVVLIFFACIVPVVRGQQPTCEAPTPWAEFHRPNMRRSNPCEKLLNVHNVGSLALKWSYTTGNVVDSSPAVTHGVIYVGSTDWNVYALNASTGAKLWSFATGLSVESSPAVANGVVYVGSDDFNVYALNAKTGAKLWSYRTGNGNDLVSSPRPPNGVVSAPTVANGVVYVGSEDQKVYALNARTGAKLWSFNTGNYVDSSPAVANGVVYVGSFDKKVYAFSLK